MNDKKKFIFKVKIGNRDWPIRFLKPVGRPPQSWQYVEVTL